MGKVHCHVCGKKCKGDVLKLQDRYFHSDCFKCKTCNVQLANTGFFVKESSYYCADDYQKLFGTKCTTCGQFVEGDVVTALGNTFHQGCFKCYDCGKEFDPGDKVTFNGKSYYCRPCAGKLGAQSPGSPSSPREHTVFEHVGRKPTRTSTPKKFENGTAQNDVGQNDSGLDQTNEEVITPTENQYQHRSPSPASSVGSHSSGSLGRRSRHESGPYEPKFDVDYGKMYPASYLKQDGSAVDEQDGGKVVYKRSRSPGARQPPKSPHFHRPENFSYTKVKSGYIKPMKKGSSTPSMMVLASESARPSSGRRTPPPPMNNEEPIKLSHYPGGHVPAPDDKPKIERDDWPGPPAPASILPEILREKLDRSKSGASDSEDDLDGTVEDPKIERNIKEMSKIKNSGMSTVILRDLEEKRKKRSVSPELDPWSCSRTPSANKEPGYRTRYESPIFASPSRDLDRPRVVDDSHIGDKCSTLPNYPDSDDVVRPHIPAVTSGSSPDVAKPGYTFGLAAKSASLPGAARQGVDLEQYNSVTNGSTNGDRRRPIYTYGHSYSLSDVENSRDVSYYSQGGRYQGSHYTEVLHHTPVNKFSALRRSTPELIQPKKFYSYDQLKDMTNLPKDVDRAKLECYLKKEDFEEIFGMSKSEFFRQAEWRRNDIKSRLKLIAI